MILRSEQAKLKNLVNIVTINLIKLYTYGR